MMDLKRKYLKSCDQVVLEDQNKILEINALIEPILTEEFIVTKSNESESQFAS